MFALHYWSTTRKMLNVAQFDFYVNGLLGMPFSVFMQMLTMIHVWRKCTPRNKKDPVGNFTFDSSFLNMTDLLLFNDLCFVAEIKTLKVQM